MTIKQNPGLTIANGDFKSISGTEKTFKFSWSNGGYTLGLRVGHKASALALIGFYGLDHEDYDSNQFVIPAHVSFSDAFDWLESQANSEVERLNRLKARYAQAVQIIEKDWFGNGRQENQTS